MLSVSTGSVSGRECQIGLQKDLNREDGNADTGDPIAGNYKSRKETLHQFGKLKTSVSRNLYRFPSRTGQMYICTIFRRHFLVIFLQKKYLLVIGSFFLRYVMSGSMREAWGFSVLRIWPLLCSSRVFSNLRMAVSRVFFCPIHLFTVFLVFPRKLHPAVALNRSVIPRDHNYSVLPFLLKEWMTSLVCYSSRYLVVTKKLKIASKQRTISQISRGWDNIF